MSPSNEAEASHEKQKFLKWSPLEDLAPHLTVEGVIYDWEGFRILLRERSTRGALLRIRFDPPLCYRVIDEGDLLRTLSQSEELGDWSLFMVNGSQLLRWFNEESFDIHRERSPKAYAIFADNDCIEVISQVEPEVEWL